MLMCAANALFAIKSRSSGAASGNFALTSNAPASDFPDTYSNRETQTGMHTPANSSVSLRLHFHQLCVDS